MKHTAFLLLSLTLLALAPDAMAQFRVPAYPSLASPATGDVLYIVDVSDTTDHASGSGRSITLGGVRSWLQSTGGTYSSMTLVAPVLGAATATSINGLTVSSSTGTLTIANGKTFTASNTITLSGTDGSTLNIGTGGTLGSAAWTEITDYVRVSSLATDMETWLAGGSSSQLADAMTDETGTGSAVFSISPTLESPNLGTPNSGTLSNCTGYSVGNLTGAGTGVLTWLAVPSSANLATALTDETGTGGGFVRATAPTLSTLTITQGSANTTALTSSGYSVTGSNTTPMITLSGTLNTSGSPNVIYMNVTNTASGGSTKLIRLDTDSTHRFSVTPNGDLVFGSAGHEIHYWSGNEIGFIVAGTSIASIKGTGEFIVGGSGILSLGGGGNSVVLRNDGADHTLSVRNGSNAQRFSAYNTYTDSTTWERLNVSWSSNVAVIGTAKGSVGGSARDLEFRTDDTARVRIKSTGELEFANGVRMVTGSGSPEGVVTAPISSTYHRTDGGAGTSFYVKESGSGNTGWVGK